MSSNRDPKKDRDVEAAVVLVLIVVAIVLALAVAGCSSVRVNSKTGNGCCTPCPSLETRRDGT